MSWAGIDLRNVSAAEVVIPTLLTRTDGEALIPPASIVGLIGESGAGKSTVARKIVREVVRSRQTAAIFDFETRAQAYRVTLEEAGMDESDLKQIVYYAPEGEFHEEARAQMFASIGTPSVIVVDAFTEALRTVIPGASSNSQDDVAEFVAKFLRQLRDHTGAAVVVIDHPTKSRENASLFASGSQHKRAAMDIALVLESESGFARGRPGTGLLKVAKDRLGNLGAIANDSNVCAMVNFDAHESGSLTVSLDPPTDALGAFRPTVLMQRASAVIEAEPGIAKREAVSRVQGNDRHTLAAIERLVAERFVRIEMDGRAHRLTSVKPFGGES
jgi:hypothetical protein